MPTALNNLKRCIHYTNIHAKNPAVYTLYFECHPPPVHTYIQQLWRWTKLHVFNSGVTATPYTVKHLEARKCFWKLTAKDNPPAHVAAALSLKVYLRQGTELNKICQFINFSVVYECIGIEKPALFY